MDTSIKAMAACAALAISTTSFAQDAGLNVFEPDTPIVASEINANFQILADRIAASSSPIYQNNKLYVFNTGTPVYGHTLGRKAMMETCAGLDSEATFCSVERIEQAIAGDGVDFAADFSGGWLDSVGYESCDAYTYSVGVGAWITEKARIYKTTDTSLNSLGGKDCWDQLTIVCCK